MEHVFAGGERRWRDAYEDGDDGDNDGGDKVLHMVTAATVLRPAVLLAIKHRNTRLHKHACLLGIPIVLPRLSTRMSSTGMSPAKRLKHPASENLKRAGRNKRTCLLNSYTILSRPSTSFHNSTLAPDGRDLTVACPGTSKGLWHGQLRV